MKIFYTFLSTLFSMLLCASAIGQISFTDQSSLLANPNVASGVAIGVADMNADGLDDVIRMDDGTNLIVEFQQPDGLPFTSLDLGSDFGGPWAVAAADVNNDGYCDIMAGGFYDDIKVWLNNGGTSFDQQQLGQSDIFVQGSNLADINNDGNLDIFNCHDDGESRINEGDGLGNFTNADDWIDMSINGSSGEPASGNYGSIWTDFDNDRDLDLYVAKCRIGVDNPQDERRINKLFVNNGIHSYNEEGGKYGLRIKHQSWTADFGDIDNDGDLDCFVTNHDHTIQILENDGAGNFTDISAQAGLEASSIHNYNQGIMRDFDNDGFIDLVTAQPTYFFRNNGDKTFSQISAGVSSFGSLAAGDLNHDGFVDLFTAYQNGFNGPSNTPDKIWINEGNDNHYLGVKLEGTESNASAVGARIEIHGSWGIQIREVRSGESYGITNSLSQVFGLGDETTIDHVVVHWPSGQMDVLNDVGADQYITIIEGTTCQLSDFQLAFDGNSVICSGESVTMIAPAGYTYLWNNGSTDETLTVESQGNYSVVIIDDMGCAAASNVAVVLENPDETPTIEPFGDTEFCEGGDVVLIASEAASYLWSNGETGENIIVSESGDYFVTVPGTCGDFTSEVISVEVFEGVEPETEDAYIPNPGMSTTLEATGDNPFWYESEMASTPIATGNVFNTPIINEETTFFVENVNEYGGGNFTAGMTEVTFSNTPWNGDNFNGQIYFDVFEMLVLEQVTVYTDQAGVREVQLLNVADDVIYSELFDLEVGENTLELNFEISPGVGYKLVTNTAVNLSSFGTNSPRLERSSEGVNYPYEVPGVLSITDSNFGSGFYYYFFNWKVDVPSLDCTSERVPVTVFIGPNAANEVESFGTLTVQPNPSTGLFTVGVNPLDSGKAQLCISDLQGRQVYAEKITVSQGVEEFYEINLGHMPSGMYFLKITNGERAGWLKIVVE